MIKIKTYPDKEISDMISQLLHWYDNYGSETTIEKLLDFQDKLSLLSVNLAHVTGKSKGTYIRAYFNRKITHSIKKMAFIDSGAKIGEAESKALSQIGELKEKEMQAEETSYCFSLELKQINRVLSAVQQRISFAKTEKQRSDNLPHDNKRIKTNKLEKLWE